MATSIGTRIIVTPDDFFNDYEKKEAPKLYAIEVNTREHSLSSIAFALDRLYGTYKLDTDYFTDKTHVLVLPHLYQDEA